MESVKELALELIKNLPDDCSMEDIQYELYVNQKIENGLRDIEQGNILTQEEMKKRFSVSQK